MNYEESPLILEEIKKAKKILVNCHRGPDMDSVGSATALARVLEKMGKDVDIICTSKIPKEFRFLSGVDKILGLVNFAEFDYSGYDLFVALDSASWQMIAYNPKAEKPKIKMIVIDHHKTNEKFGDINLVDPKSTSVGELLYRIFEDWRVEVDKDIATCLLTGILGDTGVFAYPGVGYKTFEVSEKLMAKGADKDEIILETFRTMDVSLLKFLGEVLNRIEVEQEYRFAWSTIPYDVFEKYGKPTSGKEIAASMFMQSVKGTDFGFVMVEIEKNLFSVSLRSRTGFDVTPIAIEMGGGGHTLAAGVRIKESNFEDAIRKVLDVARKYAKKTS